MSVYCYVEVFWVHSFTGSVELTKWSIVWDGSLHLQPDLRSQSRSQSRRRKDRRFLVGVRLGFLTTLGVGVGFLYDADSRCPIGSFFTSHPHIGNSCWNGTISFKKFVETDISFCAPRFPVIVKAKFHSFCVNETESGVGVGNFEKVGAGVGAGYFTTDSATLVAENETVTKSPFMPSFRAAATSIRRLMVNAGQCTQDASVPCGSGTICGIYRASTTLQ